MRIRLLLTAALATAATAAFGAYTVTVLQIPSELLNGGQPFINIFDFNNRGQVLGEAGASSIDRRGPYVWTNGVPAKLQIPAGLIWQAVYGFFSINNSGDVLGRLTESVLFGQTTLEVAHTFIWRNTVPTELHPPRFGCAGTLASVSPYGLANADFNNAGHVLGQSFYYINQGASCSEFWLYNGSSFTQVNLTVRQGNYSALSDADRIAVSYQINPPPGDPTGGWRTRVINPDGTTQDAPPGFGFPTGSNSRGQFLGFVGSGIGTHLTLWDPQTGVADVGQGGYGYLNNLGQIAFAAGFPFQTRIWDHGTSTPVAFPVNSTPPIPADSIITLFNDSGQLAGQAYPYSVVLTPTGPCAAGIGGSVAVARGGFRYNRTTQHYTQTVSITNTTASTLTGPFSLALDGLSQNAQLSGIAGATLCATPQGSPFVTNPAAALAPGAALTFTLEFINTAAAGISYSTRVLAGPGGR